MSWQSGMAATRPINRRSDCLEGYVTKIAHFYQDFREISKVQNDHVLGMIP